MAPYGACEVAQSTARSKAQFEAERFRKGFRRKKNMIESASEGEQVCSEVLSKKKEACSSSDFERSVEEAAPVQCFRMLAKQFGLFRVRVERRIYILIYILDSHMAPYGACEVAQSTARSNAQFEA